MFRVRFRKVYRRSALLRRRFMVALMLCAYLLTACGMPVSARIDKSGEPFPCQHHACGCQTAQQCWDDCCCYSKAAKLAWANERGIRPPLSTSELDALAAAEAAPSHDHSSPHGDSQKSSCCAKQETPKSCCAHQATPRAAGDQDSTDDGRPLLTKSRCRSVSTIWCVLGGGMPPPTIDWQFEWDSVEWLRPCGGSLNSLDGVPPVPPPRV
jgi:hypothetical protein